MSDKMYDELALERSLQTGFGVDIDILQPIVFRVPVSHTANATLFLTTKKQLYLYVNGPSKLLLSDIKKIITRMGLKPELFIPPKGQPHYFEDIALAKFNEVFPGRKQVNDEDLIFYRTLVPYNPALVLISEIKDGHVYQFDSDSNTNWRVGAKFAYRRIKTS
jgi:hypothetical protein